MKTLLITCEHGGNKVPKEYLALFRNEKKSLTSHLGYDPGALDLAKEMVQQFQVPFYFSEVTRLLIDLNRSLHNKSLFSSISKTLNRSEKQKIIQEFYLPYRKNVENYVKQHRPLLHISMHTFTPIWHGVKRQANIGFLYDSRRYREQQFCINWQKQLPNWIVRRNYPYLGRSDGLATSLRSQYPEKEYLGIELEVNQHFPLSAPRKWQQLKKDLIQSLEELLHHE